MQMLSQAVRAFSSGFKMCMNILEGRMLSLQEFVGNTITDYIVNSKLNFLQARPSSVSDILILTGSGSSSTVTTPSSTLVLIRVVVTARRLFFIEKVIVDLVVHIVTLLFSIHC